MVEVPLKMYIQNLAKQAKEVVRPLALIPGTVRKQALMKMADQLEAQGEEVLKANREDLDAIPKDSSPEVYRKTLDRVRVQKDAIEKMAQDIRAIAEENDPVGEMTSWWTTVDGIQVGRMRVPRGVIGVISEMGPEVTTESIAMCLKTANVCLYRGGREWYATNKAVATILRETAEEEGIPPGAILFIDRPEREGVLELVRLPKYVDGIIPRGRGGLRKAVMEQARVPVLGYDGGACHVYIDGDVEIPLAQSIVVNAKIQDPSASNAADTVLIHQTVARQLLPGLLRRLLEEFKVDLFGCPKTVSLMGIMEMTGHKGIQPATDEHWGQKFQSLTVAIKIVKDFEEALAHIAAYGPGHTDSIVTRDYSSAMRFVQEVNSSAVLVNASPRLHSGIQLDLGPDIGLNTGQWATRGPVTLTALTSEKYVGLGMGHLRHPHPVPQAYHDAMMMSPKF